MIVPLYELVGFDDNLTDHHLDQLKRAMALSWACNLGYQPCVDNAVSLYQQWMADPTNLKYIYLRIDFTFSLILT